MKLPVHDTSARQHSGESFSGLGANGGRKDRPRNPDRPAFDCEIAELVDRSTQELRHAWRTLHHTGPPLGLSRDLIIRGVVDKRKKVGDRDALIDQLWSAIEALPDPEPQPDPKPSSKQDVVIAMLRLPEGATVDEVASVTGWQRHTVRGVFSGALKKKLGLTLASAKEERGRVYRIAEPANL